MRTSLSPSRTILLVLFDQDPEGNIFTPVCHSVSREAHTRLTLGEGVPSAARTVVGGESQVRLSPG